MHAMVDNETPVVLANVTKRFKDTTAVQSVSWAPQRGQVTALVGLNGAGKSTLMRVMTGLIKPTEGSVSLTAGEGRRTLSAMIEAPALFTGLSVRRNLQIHSLLTDAGPKDIEEAAELAQIQDVMGKRAGTLSQGYRQRVAIAVALLGAPDVLLLDEPTNALDPEATVQLRHLIRRVADRNTAVIVSTHMLRELEGTADALTVLHEGRILYDGAFDSFVGAPNLRIRTPDAEATSRLAELLRSSGITVERIDGGLRAAADGQADKTAQRVFTTAAGAGIDLVELAHVTPTLEEAFQAAISGARS